MDDLGRSLLDSVEDALIVTDTDLTVSGWNGAMERLWGLPAEEAIGRNAEEVLARFGDRDLPARLRAALAGKPREAVETPYTPPGLDRAVWLQVRCVPWRRGGRIAGVLVFLRDVTAWRRGTVFVRAIEAIGHSLRSSLDLSEVLDTIAGKALEVMGAEGALVVSWDGQAPDLTVMRVAGRLSADYVPDMTIPVGGGPISLAMRQGRCVATANILSDPTIWLAPERRAKIESEGFKAVAAAPLATKGRTHGALAVHYWSERAFRGEELDALDLLAEQAALAIDNARIYADATRRADRLRELAEVEQLVTGSLDVDDVLTRIVEATARLVGADVAQVFTADPVGQVLRLRAAHTRSEAGDLGLPSTIPFGEGVAGRAAEGKTAFYVPDVTRDPRALSAGWARDSGIAKMLVVPLLAGEEVLGVLTVRSRTVTLADAENRALITSLAAQAAVAIRNARAYAEAVRRARRLHDLVAASQGISASLDTRDVMRRVANAAAALRPGALASVHVLDTERGVLRYAADVAAELQGLPGEIAASAGLPGLVFEQRTPVLVADPAHHPRALLPAWWGERPHASYYGIPITSADLFVGVLNYVVPDGLPDAEEQEALRLLAAHAGVAIRNASLYQSERVQSERVRALTSVNRRISSALQLDELLRTIAESAAQLTGVRFASFWLADEARRTLSLVASSVPEMAAQFPRKVIRYDEGLAGWVAVHRTPLVIDDLAADPRLLAPAWRERWGLDAFAGYPVLAGDELLATLCLSHAEPITLAEGTRDVIELFLAQAAVAVQNARLYASARGSLARLRDTQTQLVQAAKLSALGQLVSGVAHELNNPLSVIIGYGQLLLGRETPASVHRPVELIVAQADRMAKIVRNLLYFARQRPPERTAVNLNQVIEQTLMLRQNQLALSGIDVERDFAPDLPLAAGDTQQLEQVVLNLVLNAEQAILEAGDTGRITLRTRRGPSGETVLAEVIDDGPGIPLDVLPRVFEPFFTTKSVGVGTGLGLSVSYGIVQEHGGRLSVESAPGRTVFTIELPVAPSAEAPADDAAGEPGVPSGSGRPALVVEDEPAVLDLVTTLLTHTGWRVDVASGGRAGLERVRERRYDLIVSDMRMPDGSGEEFFRRATGRNPALARRFLFITGDTANPASRAFLDGTDVPIIEKPFQPAIFLDAVRRVTTALTPPGSGA